MFYKQVYNNRYVDVSHQSITEVKYDVCLKEEMLSALWDDLWNDIYIFLNKASCGSR